MTRPLFTFGDYNVLSVYHVDLSVSSGGDMFSCRLVSTRVSQGETLSIRGDDGRLTTFSLGPFFVPPRHMVGNSLQVLYWATTTPLLLLLWETDVPIPSELAHLPWVLPGDETQLGQ